MRRFRWAAHGRNPEIDKGGAMDRDHDESFAKSQSSVAEGIRRSGTRPKEAVFMIAGEVARDLRSAGVKGTGMLSTISALADGTARGAAEAGAGIEAVAEGFMIGAMCGADETPERCLTVIGHAADSFVRHACESGFDAIPAARGLVEGAVEWSGGCSVDAVSAAAAAAQGAVDAANDMSPRIARKVREALTAAPIAGAAVMLKETAARQ
ncbi:MAG: hypothetical protein ACHQ49_07585 [Elusimicrobiota bacterium]